MLKSRFVSVYLGGMALLLLLLVLAGVLLIGQQRAQRLEEASRHAEGEMKLIGLLARESLRKLDYQTVEDFIQSWGQEHQDVLKLQATAVNGFVLGRYERGAPAQYPFSANTRIQYSYTGALDLELVKDLSRLHGQLWTLVLQFVGGSVLLLLVLGQFLWITQRREFERQTRLHQIQLAHVARLSTMGEMVSGIAHEINQPLASMVTYAQTGLVLLKAEQLNQADLQHVLQQVAAQGLRVGEIISRLKKFARKGELKRTLADVNGLVRNATQLVAVEARERNVNIRLALAGSLRQARVDTIQIEQVIINLMRNGMEAMAESSVSDRLLTVATGARQNAIEVAVGDSGPGVEDETIEKIFDPFFTTKSEGMGLGLAISHSLVEAHGGRLWVDRDPVSGTVFRFSLPAVIAD